MGDKRQADPALASDIRHQNVEHHDLDAPMYDISHPNLRHLLERRRMREDMATLDELLAGRDTVRAVDIGAGTGRLTLQFVRRGWNVTAVDSSEGMTAILRSRYGRLPEDKRGALEIVHANAEEFLSETEGEFDLFAFSSVLHHLPDPLGVMRMCAERLAPGGCVYVTQEPMPVTGPVKTPAARIVKVLDEIVRAPQQLHRQAYRRARNLPRAKAGALVDVHVDAGLDVTALESALAEAGVQRRRFETYADRKTALIAWLDDRLFHTSGRYFRYIGQKME